MNFLWMDLAKAAPILAVLAGIAQYFQAAMLITKRPEVKGEGSKDEDMAAMMNKQMKYMMPIMTIVIGIGLPGGLTLYWLIMTLATLAQQYFIFKQKTVAVEIVNPRN
jgi:YidC/Oxa1 family membrane protein insertase